ncbi:MAG TPA: DUF2182 domain-containing protein [Gaiellaceae bacterium]
MTRTSHTAATVIAASALAAWIVSVTRMRGMDMGPGTDLGGLGWFLGIWVTMMAAMMLPSAMPMVLLFGHVAARQTASRGVLGPTAVFVAGYLGVWTAFGIVAFGLARLVRDLEPGFVAGHGRLVAGAAIVTAGLYQVTALKRLCLRHCRSPLAFLVGHWRDGGLGAIAMGAAHGAYCVGCCTGLMLILFALGVMSLPWMAVVAALVFAEKVLPAGDRLSPLIAVGLVALGLWVAVQP